MSCLRVLGLVERAEIERGSLTISIGDVECVVTYRTPQHDVAWVARGKTVDDALAKLDEQITEHHRKDRP